MSKYLYEREPGDTVLMSGPNPGGHWVEGMAKKVGFVAGGMGITLMIAIIRWILAESLAVELLLVCANKAEADIIFREEWNKDGREHASFHCYHVLEQPSKDWSQGMGHITEAMLRGHLPPPGPDTVIFLCVLRLWPTRWNLPSHYRLLRARQYPSITTNARRREKCQEPLSLARAGP